MPNYFYLDLVIRLDIMLSDFSEKKETCLEYKKTEFFKLQKIRFSKGLNPCFWSKNANFSLFRFCQNKTRNNVNYFEKKKIPFLTIKNKIFQSPKNRIFVKGVTPCFWPENVIFFLSLDLIKIRLEIKLLNLQ